MFRKTVFVVISIAIFSLNIKSQNKEVKTNPIKKYFKFTGDITYFSQSCLNLEKNFKNSFSSDIEIEGKIPKKNFLFYIHLENGRGKGLENINEMVSFSVNEDLMDTNYNVKITELYLEKDFSQKFSIKFGKLDPTLYIDENAFANDETTQFFSTVFKYNPTIDLPEHSIGGNLNLSISKDINLSTTFLSVENTNNKRFNTHFYSIEFIKSFKNLNLRTYLWENDGIEVKNKTSKGTGTNFDLNLGKLGFFFRYGKNFNTTNLMSNFISGGINLNGKLWSRKGDEIGVGFGNCYVRNKTSEKIFEVYYKLRIKDNLYISYDNQFIFNPIKKDRDRLFISGFRTYISF